MPDHFETNPGTVVTVDRWVVSRGAKQHTVEPHKYDHP